MGREEGGRREGRWEGGGRKERVGREEGGRKGGKRGWRGRKEEGERVGEREGEREGGRKQGVGREEGGRREGRWRKGGSTYPAYYINRNLMLRLRLQHTRVLRMPCSGKIFCLLKKALVERAEKR